MDIIEALLAPPPETSLSHAGGIAARHLGSAEFRRAHGVRYAYYAGSMYKGISSPDLVLALANAGVLGFIGTGGLSPDKVERAIDAVQSQFGGEATYGINLLCDYVDPVREERLVDLYLRRGIRTVEASAYLRVLPSVVRYRFSGAGRRADGSVFVPNAVIAKVSRPAVAAQFMRPAPVEIVQALRASGALSEGEADAALHAPVAADICVESDSAGHTDQGVASVLVPAIQDLRDRILAEYALLPNAPRPSIRVGMAGGLGTPRAIAAAFAMGADFVATGSINQCTVEAGTSDVVKDLLQEADVDDTCLAPAGDMFELGARVQVLKAKLQFPARANKLYELYQRLEGIDALDARTRALLEDKYFGRSLDEVWEETCAYCRRACPRELDKAEQLPKHKMALIFRFYFVRTTRLALDGNAQERANFQIHCGPAMGAFNLWVRGTPLESWRARRVAQIAERLMEDAAAALATRLRALSEASR
ncbi:PfaD family polyunsaturated fatty acid/polyketide biosynthesis protein [Xanthomonas sp. CFBP 8703]|uniref:PfaD family polyunsaturated fatty acid/polyketide biosynthesis protein n=1 Tax=Xanthomonas bonasiae TaxID=2810351 RepID=A0ABS3AWS3_9XANT|nr:PfaD family polyunsaturated fatty acid/polyketide biosynthesis protein [Xanthomonas bonasiae]